MSEILPIENDIETPNNTAEKKQKFQCPYCEKIYIGKRYLKKHVKHKHEEEFSTTDFSKILPMDNESLNQTPNNSEEQRRSINQIVQVFKCPYCDSKFGKKYTMKKHVQFKHQEEFPTTDFRKILVYRFLL